MCCSVPGSRWWAGWSRVADWLRFGPLEAAGGFEPKAAADGCSPPWHSAVLRVTPPPHYRNLSAESAVGVPVTWGCGEGDETRWGRRQKDQGEPCGTNETRNTAGERMWGKMWKMWRGRWSGGGGKVRKESAQRGEERTATEKKTKVEVFMTVWWHRTAACCADTHHQSAAQSSASLNTCFTLLHFEILN